MALSRARPSLAPVLFLFVRAMNSFVLNRRHWLQVCAAASLAPHASVFAQPGAKASDAAPIVVAQIADMSPSQQDVSRDFLIGSRAAWQDVNARGGIQGRRVQHQTIEVQGPGEGLQSIWRSVVGNPACVALSGCVGNAAATTLAGMPERLGGAQPIAQVAPWMHSHADIGASDTVFDIFPGYQAQIAHALKNLSTMGVPELGVVYASTAVRDQAQPHINQAAQALGLRVLALPIPGSSAQAGQQLAAPAQVMVLFVGGTPELHGFLRKLALPAGRHCYIVALADVNLQVLAQMGTPLRNVSVIATQSVPMVTASLPIVRAYRDALSRLYDEPPSPQGLAGFIAARYTAQVLQGVDGPPTREAVLASLRRRQGMDVGGYTLSYQGRKRIHAYVTQSMLASDGRIIG